jgi:hypothetical protein
MKTFYTVCVVAMFKSSICINIPEAELLATHFTRICGSDALSKHTFQKCLERAHPDFQRDFLGGLEPQAFFTVVDLDRDGLITGDEFRRALTEDEDERGEQLLDVVDRHGHHRQMTAESMMDAMREERQDMAMEDGMLTKKSEGTATVSEIAKNHPELARFIALGRWCGQVLTTAGHDLGDVVGLRSVDRDSDDDGMGEVKVSGSGSGSHMNTHSFEEWMRLEFVSVSSSDLGEKEKKTKKKKKKMKKKAAGEKRRFVAVLLRRDPGGIPEPPHLELKEAWLVDEEGERLHPLSVPVAVPVEQGPNRGVRISATLADLELELVWKVVLAFVGSLAFTVCALPLLGLSLTDLWQHEERAACGMEEKTTRSRKSDAAKKDN